MSSYVVKNKSLEAKITSCKLDLKRFYEISKALNLLFSTSKHTYDKSSLGMISKVGKIITKL